MNISVVSISCLAIFYLCVGWVPLEFNLFYDLIWLRYLHELKFYKQIYYSIFRNVFLQVYNIYSDGCIN